MRKARWPGNWKFDCHRCGWTYPSEDIRLEWTGLRVCRNCWEPKHPQLSIRIREETAHPAYKNKDSITTYTTVCDVQTSSGYIGLGTIGCMQIGNNVIPYTDLIQLFTNGHGDL